MSTETETNRELGEEIARRVVALVLPTLERMTQTIVALERRLQQLERERR